MVLRYPFSERLIDAIHFFIEKPESWLGIRRVKTVYQLDINEWRGERNVQFIIRYLEKIA
jgi:single-stranded-DNA-specific exonuclease